MPLILHLETLSPVTPLGAKGVGEGNCMSTPVCLANAVADALGVADIALPMTPAKLAALIGMAPKARRAPAAKRRRGKGAPDGGGASRRAGAAATRSGRCCSIPRRWRRFMPGCEALEQTAETRTTAPTSRIGVGPVRGRYEADIRLFDLDRAARA